MKLIYAVTLSLLLAPPVFADTKADLAKVRALANKVASGTDIKWKYSVHVNTDENPCAPEGTSYVATLSVRKSKITQLPSGEVKQVRAWEEVNTYVISREQLEVGGKLQDTICQE